MSYYYYWSHDPAGGEEGATCPVEAAHGYGPCNTIGYFVDMIKHSASPLKLGTRHTHVT